MSGGFLTIEEEKGMVCLDLAALSGSVLGNTRVIYRPSYLPYLTLCSVLIAMHSALNVHPVRDC